MEGITAGSGREEGAGETDLCRETDDEKDERRLWVVGGGGFIGRARELGVPGIDGIGEPMPSEANEARPKSGGAGLLVDIRRAGKSIFVTLLCCAKVNCPSFVLRV